MEYNTISDSYLKGYTMSINIQIGKKYGWLKVSKLLEIRKNRRKVFECVCKCGNICNIIGSKLINGHTKSCGCYKKIATKKRFFKGLNDISGRYFCNLKKNAEVRNLEFLISLKDMWNLFIKQNRKCAISNIDIKFYENFKDKSGTASLDRIDSSKGYVKGNIQWVHKIVNLMKQDMTDKEFINWCKIIAQNN